MPQIAQIPRLVSVAKLGILTEAPVERSEPGVGYLIIKSPGRGERPCSAMIFFRFLPGARYAAPGYFLVAPSGLGFEPSFATETRLGFYGLSRNSFSLASIFRPKVIIMLRSKKRVAADFPPIERQEDA